MALGPLGQIHDSVTDVDASVAFYRDVLGIPLLFRVPGMPMAFFDSGQVRLYLGVPENPEFTSRCVLYFTVDDIDQAFQTLRGRGVEFRDDPHLIHRAESYDLWMAFFRDLDENTFAIMARKPRG